MKRLVLIALLVVVACGASFHPGLAPVPVTPAMQRWWAEVERCTGRTGSIEAVRFALYADTAFTVFGVPLDGLFLRDSRTIILRSYDPRIIRHEMAHALLMPDTGHPAWVGVACGSILRWP